MCVLFCLCIKFIYYYFFVQKQNMLMMLYFTLLDAVTVYFKSNSTVYLRGAGTTNVGKRWFKTKSIASGVRY